MASVNHAAIVSMIIMMAMMMYSGFLWKNVILKEEVAEDFIFEKVSFEQLMKGPISIPQDHPYLIEHIRKSLYPPSVEEGYKRRRSREEPSQLGQPQAIRRILGDKKKGFFVEAGACDGELFSNTLSLERDYGWTGVLVEANPFIMPNIMKMQRKAWAINNCLSTKAHPHMVSFFADDREAFGKIADEESKESGRQGKNVEVQCFPLYSIMMALNTTTVDYFSLDIEGAELDVLMTIPWDKLNIRTLSVEFNHIPDGKNALRKYMESVGYVTYGTVNKKMPIDYIFHKKDVIPVLEAPENGVLDI